MSNNTNNKHPAVSGDRRRQAEEEMQDPGFHDYLAKFVSFQCEKIGILRGPGMIGGDDPHGLATNAIIAVLEGKRRWPENMTFAAACRGAAMSIAANYKDRAANKLSWNLVSTGTEEWSDNETDDGTIDETKTAYPPSNHPTPTAAVIAKETKELKDARIRCLQEQVTEGSLEEKILQGLRDSSGEWGRKQIREETGCTENEVTAAIVRIRKLVQRLDL